LLPPLDTTEAARRLPASLSQMPADAAVTGKAVEIADKMIIVLSIFMSVLHFLHLASGVLNQNL
jgi:hypothetical protein